MIAIIPARGGSKRIPGKNIRQFFGKPIIAYVIETALESKLFDEVFVSTDSEEIAGIAKKYGASVPVLRSGENSDDFASTSDVLIEVMEYLEGKNSCPGEICCIYPTSVLVDAKDLRKAACHFLNSECAVMLPCVAYSYPVQRSFTLKNNEIQLSHPEFINSRSQDLEVVFHDAGSFYFFKTEEFRIHRTIWQEKITPYVLDENKVQDIDNLSDWKLAELKYKMLLDEKL